LKKWNKELPTARLLGNYEDGSPEWHALRAGGIGGSEIGTILGLNPWESAYTLFHKRLGLIEDNIENNWPIRFGKAFESAVLGLFGEEHSNLEVMQTGTFVSNDNDWMHANPDALAQDKTDKSLMIVEVKTARSSWSELPPHYEAQVMWYMHVTGIKKAVVVGVNGMTYQEFYVDYDPFIGKLYEDRALEFWNALKDQVAPNWDGSKSTFETVRELHPEISDESVDLHTFGHELKDAQMQYEQAEYRLNEIKSKVIAAMDKARYGYVVSESGEQIVVAQRQSRNGGKPFLQIK
jgi:putative phage-type endonuclease